MEVKIFITPNCPYCKKSINWLNKHNISFSIVDVSKDKQSADFLVKLTQQTGVPVIYLKRNNEQRTIIGYDVDSFEEEFSSLSASSSKSLNPNSSFQSS